MKRKMVICGKFLVFSVVIIFALSSFANAAPEGKPIKIGVITNVSAPYGKTTKVSMEIAVKEINDSGGILGRPVQLIVEDWKRQVPMAIAAYRKLVMKEKCPVVFTEGSEAIFALMEEGSKMYKSYPHIQIGNYTAADAITVDTVCANYEKYKFFFRPFSRMYDQFDPRIKAWTLMTEVLGVKKVALVIEDIAFTKTMLTGKPGVYPPFKGLLEQHGLEVVLQTQVGAKETMFLPTFELIAKSGAEALLWAGAYTNHTIVAKQWAQSAAKDIDIWSLSGSSSYKNFIPMTGGSGLGWIAQFPEIDIPYTSKSIPFLKELRAKGAGLMVSTYAAHDGPFFMKAAIEKVGNEKDVLAIIKTLETEEFQNAFWIWKFDKCHDPVKGYPYYSLVYAQHQGADKYVVVWPEEIRKMVNPNDKFIPVKELRKMVQK